MKRATPFVLAAAALLLQISLISLSSAQAQNCRLQIRCSGFEPLKGYAFLKISFASTNSCAGVRVAVEWSDDLVTWHPVTQAGGLPCLTQGAEVQVVDETNSRTRLCR